MDAGLSKTKAGEVVEACTFYTRHSDVAKATCAGCELVRDRRNSCTDNAVSISEHVCANDFIIPCADGTATCIGYTGRPTTGPPIALAQGYPKPGGSVIPGDTGISVNGTAGGGSNQLAASTIVDPTSSNSSSTTRASAASRSFGIGVFPFCLVVTLVELL